MFCAALSMAAALLTQGARADVVLDARCTGEPDIAWAEQIAGCSRTIDAAADVKARAKALLIRAKAHGQLDDMGRSLADVEAAIALDPGDAIAVASRGDVHLVLKQYEAARADYDRAAALAPDNALIVVGRGIAHIGMKEFDRALGDFEQAVRMQPSLAAGLYWRGITRQLRGDAAAGDADIAAAKRIDPDIDR